MEVATAAWPRWGASWGVLCMHGFLACCLSCPAARLDTVHRHGADGPLTRLFMACSLIVACSCPSALLPLLRQAAHGSLGAQKKPTELLEALGESACMYAASSVHPPGLANWLAGCG